MPTCPTPICFELNSIPFKQYIWTSLAQVWDFGRVTELIQSSHFLWTALNFIQHYYTWVSKGTGQTFSFKIPPNRIRHSLVYIVSTPLFLLDNSSAEQYWKWSTYWAEIITNILSQYTIQFNFLYHWYHYVFHYLYLEKNKIKHLQPFFFF